MPSATSPEYLPQTFLGLAVITLALLTPFVINNFIQSRWLIGLGSLGIVVIFAINTWSILRHQRYYSQLTLVFLAPAILIFLALSVSQQGTIGVLWCYPAVISFYFMLPERQAYFSNVLLLILILPIAWISIEPALALRMIATLLMISLFAAIFISVINNQQRSLQHQIVTDPLTGLLNRTLLQSSLEHAIAQYKRNNLAMTLLTLDIDHFKTINDRYGHAKGDDVLKAFAQVLSQRLRESDRAFRMGGEEFVIILFESDLGKGQLVAEELRERIAALDVLPEGHITVSIGVAQYQQGETWGDWLKRSDNFLYEAKHRGRNQVVSAAMTSP